MSFVQHPWYRAARMDIDNDRVKDTVPDITQPIDTYQYTSVTHKHAKVPNNAQTVQHFTQADVNAAKRKFRRGVWFAVFATSIGFYISPFFGVLWAATDIMLLWHASRKIRHMQESAHRN